MGEIHSILLALSDILIILPLYSQPAIMMQLSLSTYNIISFPVLFLYILQMSKIIWYLFSLSLTYVAYRTLQDVDLKGVVNLFDSINKDNKNKSKQMGLPQIKKGSMVKETRNKTKNRCTKKFCTYISHIYRMQWNMMQF